VVLATFPNPDPSWAQPAFSPQTANDMVFGAPPSARDYYAEVSDDRLT
jgi:hypothetical protein